MTFCAKRFWEVRDSFAALWLTTLSRSLPMIPRPVFDRYDRIKGGLISFGVFWHYIYSF